MHCISPSINKSNASLVTDNQLILYEEASKDTLSSFSSDTWIWDSSGSTSSSWADQTDFFPPSPFTFNQFVTLDSIYSRRTLSLRNYSSLSIPLLPIIYLSTPWIINNRYFPFFHLLQIIKIRRHQLKENKIPQKPSKWHHKNHIPSPQTAGEQETSYSFSPSSP